MKFVSRPIELNFKDILELFLDFFSEFFMFM
jgi:hypothetical protein